MIKKTRQVRLRRPVFILCWPGMGEVAIKAGLFLNKSLGFKKFAHIESSGCFQPQGVISKKGILELPKIDEGTFYYYKRKSPYSDVVLFLAQAQPPMDKAYRFAQMIADFASSVKASKIFTFAAFPQAIEHTSVSSVWVSATDKKMLTEFNEYKPKLLNEGQISGLNGLVLGAAKNKKIKGACLLGEIPFYTIQIENPKASLAVLKVLSWYLQLDVSLRRLKQRSSHVEKEIDKLIGFLKDGKQHQENMPLGEEDIQKMKRELEKYTKLPESARKKIEDLFKKASKDISYASELKKILDEWGAYGEYEDRFLDLFKKKRFDH